MCVHVNQRPHQRQGSRSFARQGGGDSGVTRWAGSRTDSRTHPAPRTLHLPLLAAAPPLWKPVPVNRATDVQHDQQHKARDVCSQWQLPCEPEASVVPFPLGP